MFESLLLRLSSEKATPEIVNEAVSELRGAAEDEVVAFLISYSKVDAVGALFIAVRVLASRRAFDVLLMHGLRTGDASSMKAWLECCMPRVGRRGVLDAMKIVAAESPTQAGHALYWAKGLWGRDRDWRQGLNLIEAKLPPGR